MMSLMHVSDFLLIHAPLVSFPTLALDPLIDPRWIAALFGLAFMGSLLAGLGRMRSAIARILAAVFVLLALLNPQRVIEEREALQDTVLVISDQTGSVKLGPREKLARDIEAQLQNTLSADPTLDIVNAAIPDGNNGTALASTLIEALGNLPASRLAGVIAITDGQVHDLPDQAHTLLPDNVPFHSVIIGDPKARDRRIRALLAPQFGLVGERASFEVLVDDPGYEGERAGVQIKLNGELKGRFPITIGNKVTIPLEIERRGLNTVELIVNPADDELTLINNVFVSEISGIRDRLRVLLVTGQPHQGGRAWRNLLKSDPGVDLVQFTILTNPGSKRTYARQRELSLIAFPTRQLFEEKLEEFDLIIFDQFQRRTTPGRTGRANPILSPFYLQNVARYVDNGGALLVATGPAFATEQSLYRSPLAAVLPSRPTGKTVELGFRPRINDKGRRHPITSAFNGQDKDWGRWFRIVDNNALNGHVLMEGPDAEPLLIVDKIGDGRVAMLMSDQAWLWSRGYEGGGPYSEIFRRLSHWLMGEPDLDAEKLSARTQGSDLLIERRTLEDSAPAVTVKKPDGSTEIVTLKKIGDGLFQGLAKTNGQGAYRLETPELSTVAAIGALNPKEFSNLTPTGDILTSLSNPSGGGIFFTPSSTDDLPRLRRIKTGQDTYGEGWLGLIAHDAFTVTASDRTPLTPALLLFFLALLSLAWAWRQEGR